MNDKYIEYLERKPLKHLLVDGSGRVGIDHADAVKKVSDYIGSWLVAKRNVNIYNYPGGAVIATRFPSQNIGRIYSYKDYYGTLYWQLEGTGAGNGTGGWVKHEIGAFDSTIAMDTGSGKEHDAHVAELDAIANEPNAIDKLGAGVTSVFGGIGTTLNNLGQFLPLIIGAIALFVIVTALAKAKSL